ncbi:MAG: DUF3021 domain-containing protein [Lachnospiraceae bacterium]|nr:DUF3021 domain-containing protein [Lachnospiraceae bacterium]
MSRLLKRTIIMCTVGFIMGMAVGVILLLTGCFDYFPEEILADKIPKCMIVSGFMGVAGMGGTVLYEIENWSIMRATVTHFVIVIVAFLTMAYVEEWYRFGDMKDAVLTFILYVIVFFFIWLIMYLIAKKNVKEMNEALKALRPKDEEKQE